MSPKFAAFDVQGNITAYYDDIDSPVPSGVTSVIKITDAQWQACISTLGYTVKSGALVAPTAPTAAQLLASAQAAQITTLKAAYNTAIQQPVSFTAAGSISKTFQADMGSQNVLLIATTGYNLAGATPSGFYWVSSDNTQVPFMLADLKGLYGVMLAQGNTAFQKLQTLKAQVNAATTAAAVQAITWN
jgi:hypothetical protein